MRRSTWIWVGTGLMMIMLAAGLAVTRSRAPAATPGGPTGGSGRGPAPMPVVGVGHPTRTVLATTLTPTASIISLRQAPIASKVAGYLQAVTVRPGDLVAAGQVVAVVDHAQLDAQVSQAEAAVRAARTGVQTAQAAQSAAHAQVLNAQASASRAEADRATALAALAKAQSQLALAQAAYARAMSLYRDGLIAAQAMDAAKADADSAAAAVDAANAQVQASLAGIGQARAQVRAAQAQETAAASQVRTQQAQVATLEAALETARLARGSATIRAPWAGIVVQRNLDPGAYVSPGGASAILVIADLDHIAAIVSVPEGQMAGLHTGNAATVTVDAYPGRTFHGVVSRIAGGVDPDTRTVQAEIDIPNPGHRLRPGMFARMTLAAGTRSTLVVPLSALTVVGNQPYVWILTDGRVHRHAVTVGQATGQDIEIASGLAPQDTIVVRGTELVSDDVPVRAVPVGN